MRKTLPVLLLLVFTFFNVFANESLITSTMLTNTIKAIKTKTALPDMLVDRGVTQAAALWTEADGTSQEFDAFCRKYFCATLAEKTVLFNRICDQFEVILGHENRIAIELQRPEQVVGYEPTAVDALFSAYDGMAHFKEDMFQSKLAFVVILNFPHYTLTEKQQNGARWSDLEWGFVRLGDVFTDRVPAEVQQALSNATAAANGFVDNFNIDLAQVGSYHNEFFWPNSLPLITHWGLRDELKSAYADASIGLAKQEVIYDVMKRIINEEVPADVARHNTQYKWYPSTNQLMLNNIQILSKERHGKSRYQYLLDFFHQEQKMDAHCKGYQNFIQRKFEEDYEISVEQVEKLFEELLTSPQVNEVAELISKRLGRKLQPFDIWYDGFKDRSSMDQQYLDSLVRTKYPTKEAFAQDLPNILMKLGFTSDKAQWICSHVTVDASVGAGHAWESMMRNDNAMLRTRVGADGMDYKGYNIGVHEFGHNVEQTISLHEVPNYFLRGVPNTAFTEALAFTFQNKDLELLGIPAKNEKVAEDLNTLDIFWGCYEIMGVSMVDIKVWKWMYEHPQANADQLQEAVITIAKEVWNTYYQPVFKSKDEPILAIYSHMIVDPLYLSAYPIGHIIDFQLESFLKDKNIGTEVARIYKIGRVHPDLWMQRAVGAPLSVQPLLDSTNDAVKRVRSKDKK